MKLSGFVINKYAFFSYTGIKMFTIHPPKRKCTFRQNLQVGWLLHQVSTFHREV